MNSYYNEHYKDTVMDRMIMRSFDRCNSDIK